MVLRSVWTPDKRELVASQAMVVAKHPLAADAGIAVLQDGGNAVDAAVAMGFALCVVKPMMTCLGGVGFLLAHDAGRGEQWSFDGAPRAPQAATDSCYEVVAEDTGGIGLFRVRDDENSRGHRAVAVPGLVAALCTAHQRLGKLPLRRVLEPAIALAEEGWAVDWAMSMHAANAMPVLAANPAAAAVFLPDGFPPRSVAPKTVLRQRDLAETLRRIAAAGADGFYRGEIAHAIADDMRAHGGWITAEDLAAYPHLAERPRAVPYRDVQVLFPPMPCGGTTAAETLRILEQFDVGAAGRGTAPGLHLFIEAARRAFADRFHYFGDPVQVSVPIEGLLSAGHAAELAALIAPDRATLSGGPGASEPWARFAATPPPGDPWRFDGGQGAADLTGARAAVTSDTCTTHLAVVDGDRNAVCCTITAAGLFGAGVVTPGTGVLFNNGMTWFNPVPGAANSIAPGKRAVTNMSPLMVMRDGQPYLLVGAPGGRKIINAVTQIVCNVVDHGLGMQAAVTAPRVDASANETLVDDRFDPEIVPELEELGHTVRIEADGPGEHSYSRPLAILVDMAAGTLHSGLTPFHIAEARGL